MANGSQTLTTYYAKRIIGDSAAVTAAKALLQTGDNVTTDLWLLHRSNRGTSLYGILYKYDGTNDHDKLQVYGASNVTAWVQLDTGDTYLAGKVGIGYDPNTSGNVYKLYVNGTSYFNGQIEGAGGIILPWIELSSATPYIDWHFGSSSADYTSRIIESSSGYLEVNAKLGINGSNTGYNFYVNGSSYLNGNTTHNGIIYFANGTTYYINNSGYGNLHGLNLDANLTFSNSGTDFRGINYGTMGDNDQWRIGGAATGSNAGYMEIATADDGTEPIYVRQYTGVFSSLTRTATLLDANGYTQFPSRVGIGMSPAYNLDISGAARASAEFYTQTSFYARYNLIQWYNNAWWTTLWNHDNGNLAIQALGGSIYLGYTNTTEIHINTNSAEKACFDANHLYICSRNAVADPHSGAAIEIRETSYGGAYDGNEIYCPRIGFHWGGRVAAWLGLLSDGWFKLGRENGAYYGIRTGSHVAYGDITATNNLYVSTNNTTGGGIILADDGDIVDLNDAYCSMRFTYGVRIFSANRGGSAVITLNSSGDGIFNRYLTVHNRIYAKEWIQFDNWTGLYSPNNNAHFLPNAVSSYGQWRLDGGRNGYSGIHLGPNTNYMTLMDNSSDKGLYQEGQRWIIYYSRATGRLSLRDSYSVGWDTTNNGSFFSTSTIGTWGLYECHANGAVAYFGCQNTSYVHFTNNAGRPYYFDNNVYVNGTLYWYPNSAYYWNGNAGYSSTYYTNNWFRSYNATGWYNESYGGGIWMTDPTWVRVYNGKGLHVDNTIEVAVNGYPSVRLQRTDAGEVSQYFINNTAGWAIGINPWGIGAGGFGIGQYSGAGSSTWRFRIDNNGYCYTNSYLNLGAGNENNASSPPRVWGTNGGDNFVRSYQTHYLRAGYLDGWDSNPNNSHPGYGARVFYSWNIGQAFNDSAGYSNGITIGSHPGDQAYGFQIVQNMWNDQTYTRRYNGGWQSWRTLMNCEDNQTVTGFKTFTQSIHVSQNNATGGGIILSDDGDIVDLNDGYCALRFSYGIGITTGNRSGGYVTRIHSNGNIYMSPDRRIGESGGNLYLGNSGNQGWLYLQDTASQAGHGYWRMYTDGSLYCNKVSTRDPNGFRVVYGSYGFIIRNDSSNTYFMPATNAEDGNTWYGHYSYVENGNGFWHFVRAYGAVWNDYAEYRIANTIEPGRVVKDTKNGKMELVNERLAPACKVISDTYGFAIGETIDAKTPIAVSGRVLVYPYQSLDKYEIGAAVCSAPGGTVDIMTREEVMQYPERIIGTVSEIPNYGIWKQTRPDVSGKNNPYTHEVPVKGRIWIYVR